MLLFDLTATQGYGSTKQHGGGKYAEIVFEELCQSGARMIGMWDSRRWISKKINSLCEKYNIKKVDYAIETIDSIVQNNRIESIYSALPNDELLRFKGCKSIVTLHGLRSLEMPNDYMLLRYPMPFREKIKRFFKLFLPNRYLKRNSFLYYGKFFRNEKLSIITVSYHTKYSIATYYPQIAIDTIHVFYSPSTSFPIQAPKRARVENYFLMVSTNREEKNALRAIMAFDRLFCCGELEDFHVKLTGIESNIFNYKIKNIDKFEFCGYVDDNILNQLYANAHAFVYPSFTEGFGYPPIEAMRYGIPVIASPFTSIPEICGDAAIYFNPFSIEEMMNRLLMITNKDIYEQYASKCLLRYKQITNRQHDDLKNLVRYIMSNSSNIT